MPKLSALILMMPAFSIFLLKPFTSSADTEGMQQAFQCERASSIAARETGVPHEILKAISRTESGTNIDGKLMPWPWTINVEGHGVRFETEEEALVYFREHFARGSRNIDVGCFQINHKWHGREFSSVEEMLDPVFNARYAAEFLKTLYAEFGDWISASGAYHSRNEKKSNKYLARFSQILAGVGSEDKNSASDIGPVPRPNTFPLLQGTSKSASRGSLFPSNINPKRNLLVPTGERG